MTTLARLAVLIIAAVVAALAAGLVGCSTGESTVPGVRSASFEFAYQRLHDAGLRVRIEQPLTIATLCSPFVGAQEPTAGTRVSEGAVVTLRPQPCFQGTAAVRNVSATVPDFLGRPPSEAAEWAAREGLFYELRLAPLSAGDAPTFFENFRIVRQQPPPGATLRPGVRRRGGFTVTPVVVFAEAR